MRRTLVHFPFHKILHERNRLVYPQHRDIYRKVVGGCNAPFLIRIIVIISSTRLVGLQHQFLRLFDRQVLAFDDPLNTVFLVVMNKETQAVRIVTKDIVGTSSDNHTRTFFRQVTDRIALIQEQTVVRQYIGIRREQPIYE